METGAAALIVVDVQNGFVTEHSAHVVRLSVDLVKRWQAAGRDVVFTRYINHEDSIFERLMGWTKLQHSPAIDIVPDLQPYVNGATAVVDKRVYTLFTDEGEQHAKDRGWTDVYVCGIDTEVCVLKTAVDAFERNIVPRLVVDASASHSGPKAHNAGLIVAAKMLGPRQLVQSADAN
ncbi:cysteine hydrolase family protein [Pseudonocardia charpentierae]|uniref:Isochorismatase family cysteine hydrolase n=1 Tax=Pseudonocardia charpentierae TaxID=3075545 RepID=A0ABU2N6F2_9PSEU|nr:isochorismatase family cysteine hydrolase [Pseudonocardia sp. DSM 45834]MDT0349522.1 isochorismatase family cysteine hydrolase [Pseudonocardia sp. DSM 45834]